MFNLFNKKKTPIVIIPKPFLPEENRDNPGYLNIIDKMRAWGRPPDKTTLKVQLCSLDLGLDKRGPDGNLPMRIRLYLDTLDDEQFRLYMNQVYGLEACG